MQPKEIVPVDEARSRWLAACEAASNLAAELFQPGSGYGDPEALKEHEHRLQRAREAVEWRFREYEDLQRAYLESNMLRLQRSQVLATWASFAVAAAVSLATIVNTVLVFFK